MTIVGTSVPYYLEAGLGDRVVLMLHGIGGGHGDFAPQMKAATQAGWRALAWDMPGYGYSRTVSPYTLAALADACLELIELQDAKQVVLMGHSMGGMVAQEVAARAPTALAGLVLFGTTAAFGRPDGTWQRDFLAERFAPLDRGESMADLAAVLVADMLGKDADPGVLAQATASMAAVPAPTYRHALTALVDFDQREALALLAMPVLVVSGSRDRTAPAAVMEKMAARIPGARYAQIANAGHLMHRERPEELNTLLVDFLAEHFPDTAAKPMP